MLFPGQVKCYVNQVHAVPVEARRGHQIPGTKWTVVNHHVGSWELSLHPLREQQALITAEPFLQPSTYSWLIN